MIDFELNKSYFYSQIVSGKDDLEIKVYGAESYAQHILQLKDEENTVSIIFVLEDTSHKSGWVYRCIYNNTGL